MTYNIQNTGYTIGSDGIDIATVVTSWSIKNINGNRILISGESNGLTGYFFPQPGYGLSSTINGQIVTIFNQSDTSIYIFTENNQVYFNGSYYGTNTPLLLPSNKLVTFVLIQGAFYVQIAYVSI